MYNHTFEKSYRFQNKHGHSILLYLDRATRSDLEEIIILQEEVVVSLSQYDLFEKSTREEIMEGMQAHTAYVLRDASRHVVAFSLFVFHNLGPRNLGNDLGYTLEEKRITGVFDTVFTGLAYRGYGIQRFFLWLCEEEARLHRIKYILATVSSQNYYSLDNFIKYGYQKEKEVIKYRDKKRWIVSKHL